MKSVGTKKFEKKKKKELIKLAFFLHFYSGQPETRIFRPAVPGRSLGKRPVFAAVYN